MVEPFNSSVEMDYDKMVYENKGWGENMTGGGDEQLHRSVEMLHDEMVYNKEDDKIMAGGYAVNSLLLNQGMPAAYTEHVGGKGKHDKVSDRFKHLAVPAGLYLSSKSKPVQSKSMQSKSMQSKPMHSDISVINDDLYEKLLKLAQHDNTNTNKKAIYKKKTTKKKQHKKSMKKKTKKRKY